MHSFTYEWGATYVPAMAGMPAKILICEIHTHTHTHTHVTGEEERSIPASHGWSKSKIFIYE
jgi:hypothetical protein